MTIETLQEITKRLTLMGYETVLQKDHPLYRLFSLSEKVDEGALQESCPDLLKILVDAGVVHNRSF